MLKQTFLHKICPQKQVYILYKKNPCQTQKGLGMDCWVTPMLAPLFVFTCQLRV